MSNSRTISPKTLKSLYAHSGNKCAFPNCNQILVYNAGCKTIFITSGEGKDSYDADYETESLFAAVNILLSAESDIKNQKLKSLESELLRYIALSIGLAMDYVGIDSQDLCKKLNIEANHLESVLKGDGEYRLSRNMVQIIADMVTQRDNSVDWDILDIDEIYRDISPDDFRKGETNEWDMMYHSEYISDHTDVSMTHGEVRDLMYELMQEYSSSYKALGKIYFKEG